MGVFDRRSRHDSFDREFRRSQALFRVAFVAIAAMVLTTFAVSAWLFAACYTSGDVNSMACFMISDRVEIGVRER